MHDDNARALGRFWRAVELEAHRNGDDFIKVHAGQIHVDHIVAEESELEIFDEAGLRRLAFDRDIEHMQTLLECCDCDLVIDSDRDRRAATTVDDRWKAADLAQTL